jgi:hypothetical protein
MVDVVSDVVVVVEVVSVVDVDVTAATVVGV